MGGSIFVHQIARIGRFAIVHYYLLPVQCSIAECGQGNRKEYEKEEDEEN